LAVQGLAAGSGWWNHEPPQQGASLMIKAVLFDLFETLITESRVQPTRASSLGASLGLEQEAFRVEWKVRRPRVVLGQLSFADALTEIAQTLTGRVDTAAVQRIYEQRIREKAAVYARIDEQVEGVAKPGPEIYLRAAHRLGVQPATVFIGDGGDNELVGAEQAGLRGFRAAWFTRDRSSEATGVGLAHCQDVLELVAASV
jgi:FMN phosphatase YigB (HAD superfamily)